MGEEEAENWFSAARCLLTAENDSSHHLFYYSDAEPFIMSTFGGQMNLMASASMSQDLSIKIESGIDS